MNRILKLTGQIVALLIVVYIVIMLLLVAFVKTKDFTPIVTKLFYQETGQKLKIDGKLELSIFPWPAVRASNITIDNPKGFPAPASARYLAHIGRLSARLRVIDLLHGNVQVANVFLNKVDLNLITARSGKTNWQNLTKYKHPATSGRPNKGAIKRPMTTDRTDPIKQAPKLDASQFPVIEINNSSIHFINLQANSKTDLTNFSLSSPRSRDRLIREIVFSTQVQHDDPKTRVGLRLGAKVHFNPDQGSIKLEKLIFSAKWHQIQHTLAKPIALIMRGDATFQNGNFQTSLHGHFGESAGKISLAMKRQNNSINANLQLKNVALKPLVTVLTGKEWLDGTINASTNLATSGNTYESWLGNLSGKGSFNAKNGNIHGLNMDLMVTNTLNQLLTQNKQLNSSSTTSVTAFKTISADFTINRGQLTSSNFLLDASTVKATGKGKINLPAATINATLMATYVKNPSWRIPLIVRGPLFKPVIQPDTSKIASGILKKNMNKHLGKTLDNISKSLKGLFNSQ